MGAVIKDFEIFQYAYEKCIEDEIFAGDEDTLFAMLDILTKQAVQDLIFCRNDQFIAPVLNYNLRRQSELKEHYFNSSSESDSDAQEPDSGYTSNWDDDYENY